MEEMSKHNQIGKAAMKAGMDRKTARKYVDGGKLPSELATARDWRTRADPFDEHWPQIEERLRITPELEAKTLFELLQEQHPERYQDGQLRTLQRRVRWWRAAHGPEQEIVLGQEHRPGSGPPGRSWTGRAGPSRCRTGGRYTASAERQLDLPTDDNYIAPS